MLSVHSTRILKIEPSERKSALYRLMAAVGGLLLQIMLLLSIFDIYFRSPIVQNLSAQPPRHEPLSRRVVLFSVDGLRAESFIEHNHTEYLRSIAINRGLWGISHARVPTESRPGHIAIFAGFYEDPSAVTRGWKNIPVDFDTVFNRSRYTWNWGYEGILKIFSNDNNGHIFSIPYNTDETNYFDTHKNATLVDKWVFDRVKKYFDHAKSDEELMKKLRSDKIILFIHLSGTDKSGHLHDPNSREHTTSMRYVDNGIKEIENLFERFYAFDGKTTYIMTSDHGMTNWGSHGAGDKHETETPYVIWGAGVAEVISKSEQGFLFGLPKNKSKDITQADLAPLMSALISISIPVNSVGKLPIDLLNMTLEDKAKALYSNSLQLATQYNALRRQVERGAMPALYVPYEPFTGDKYKELLAYAERMLCAQEYDHLIMLSERIMRLSLSGLSYYHNYYQGILLKCITFCFFGWICLLLTILIGKSNVNDGIHVAKRKHTFFQLQTLMNLLFTFIVIVVILLIFVQRLPTQYYLYCLVPVLLWWRVLLSARTWGVTLLGIVERTGLSSLLLQVLCYAVGTTTIVWSFSERWWLSIPLLGMAVWPFVSAECRQTAGWALLAGWAASCVMLGLFSFLPVVGKKARIELVLLSGLLWLGVMLYFVYHTLLPMFRSGRESKKELFIIGLQCTLLIMALQNIYMQNKRYARKTKVKKGYQVLAWIIAEITLLLPILSSGRQMCRLLSVYSGLLTFYLLLSVSHEGLFLLTLVLNQVCWMLIEFRLVQSKNKKVSDLMFFGSETHLQSPQDLVKAEKPLTPRDFSRAFFVVLYIMICFFGTGNIATISSFQVRWVTCFITAFVPWVILTLVLCKTMAPILVVACSFRAINIITKAPMRDLMLIVLLFSNMMGVQFLFLVRNTGTWLQIGSSISQYVISQVMILFILVLHAVAKVLTESIINPSSFNKLRIRITTDSADSKQSHQRDKASVEVTTV